MEIDAIQRDVHMNLNFMYKVYELLERINKNLEEIKNELKNGIHNKN
jgi:hypothetical protein